LSVSAESVVHLCRGVPAACCPSTGAAAGGALAAADRRDRRTHRRDHRPGHPGCSVAVGHCGLRGTVRTQHARRTREVIEGNGWSYEVAAEPSCVKFFTNVRYLAGYRRKWLFNEAFLNQIRRYASSIVGAPIRCVAEKLPEHPWPLVHAALMHLLWQQDFRIDLDRPLESSTALEESPLSLLMRPTAPPLALCLAVAASSSRRRPWWCICSSTFPRDHLRRALPFENGPGPKRWPRCAHPRWRGKKPSGLVRRRMIVLLGCCE
jgi:hypothetical protein